VNYEKYEYIELTQNGEKVGKEIHRRHEILLKFLSEILKIEFTIADQEACKMEHALSAATLDRLIDFMEFIQMCPRTGDSWLHYFEEYRKHGRRPAICRERSGTFACEFKNKNEGGVEPR
jgi:DtxR family Mn-dependent transcriptional regulator